MKKRAVILFKIVFMIAVAAVLSECKFRPFDGEYTPGTALVPVHIDWSVSGVPTDQIHRVSLLFFPKEGGKTLEIKIEDNITDNVIKVPVGVYSVVVFNETTNQIDWTGITFTGKDSYDEFAAVALPQKEYEGFYASDDTLPLIKNPDPLAAWSLDSFEVTEDMLIGSRSQSRADTDEAPGDLMNIRPTPRFETMTVTAQVENLSSAMQATGILEDMASGVYMASGERMKTQGAHAFIFSGRTYFSDEYDGTTTATFNIFGRSPASSAHCELCVDFVLNDGTLFPRQSFDAATMITTVPDAVPPAEIITIGKSDIAPDHEIELPADVGTGEGVKVNDWNEVEKPLK
jgi:hypothetical protein